MNDPHDDIDLSVETEAERAALTAAVEEARRSLREDGSIPDADMRAWIREVLAGKNPPLPRCR